MKSFQRAAFIAFLVSLVCLSSFSFASSVSSDREFALELHLKANGSKRSKNFKREEKIRLNSSDSSEAKKKRVPGKTRGVKLSYSPRSIKYVRKKFHTENFGWVDYVGKVIEISPTSRRMFRRDFSFKVLWMDGEMTTIKKAFSQIQRKWLHKISEEDYNSAYHTFLTNRVVASFTVVDVVKDLSKFDSRPLVLAHKIQD